MRREGNSAAPPAGKRAVGYPGGAFVLIIIFIACFGVLATVGGLWFEASNFRIISNAAGQESVWRSIEDAVLFDSETVSSTRMDERTAERIQAQVRDLLAELAIFEAEMEAELARRERFPGTLFSLWVGDLAKDFTGVEPRIREAVERYANAPAALSRLGVIAWDTDIQFMFRSGSYRETFVMLIDDLRATARHGVFSTSMVIIIVLCALIIGAYAVWMRYARRAYHELQGQQQSLRKAYQRIRQSNDQLSTAFNALSEPACLTDEKGRILASNGLFRSFFQDEGEAKPECFADIAEGKTGLQRPAYETAEMRMSALVAGMRRESEFRYRERELKWRVEDLVTGGFLIIAFDQTQFLAQKEEQLHSQRLEVMGLLSSKVAHDFNNILAALMAKSELLIFLTPDDANVKKELQSLVDICERGRSLTSQLLSYSRRQKLELNIVDAVKVADRLREQLSTPEHIRLEVEPPPPGLTFRVDANHLVTATENLVRNAVEAIGGDDGEIRLSFQCVSGAGGKPVVRVEVADTGGGLSQEAAERATEPFFSTKYEQNGTGLGLAMVAGFVQQCKGRFEICNGDRGAICRMDFPAVDECVDPGAESLREDIATFTLTRDDSRVCLLLEDDEELREFFTTFLKRSFGEVKVAADCATAIKHIETAERIDAALCDWNLPDGNCEPVLHKLRSRYPGSRIVVMTGYLEDYIRREAGRLRVKLFTKPAPLAEVIRAFRDG